ncbi:MAG TPA: amidohydrolase family protein [Acidobacteriota bacterium]|nr:amidohydrolase family protein [Acidobacteriota bacterium]
MKKVLLILICVIFLLVPSYAFEIVNIHEHIESVKEADKLLVAMDANEIATVILVGSPRQTLFSGVGFTEYDENNEQILTLVKKYPGRFKAFVTINPRDEDALEKLKSYMAHGASGVKLYSGHTIFVDLPLNYSGMDPVYAYIEKEQIPLIWHVNPADLQDQFEDVLTRYPTMKVLCPHYCLSSINESRFRYLMDTYPQLYTDISFGFDPFAQAGFKRVSRNTTKFVEIFTDYQDRILFGTDNVITSNPKKTVDWITDFGRCYRDMLEKSTFDCAVVNSTGLNGLSLDDSILEKVYERNAERFLTEKSSAVKVDMFGQHYFKMLGLFLLIFLVMLLLKVKENPALK